MSRTDDSPWPEAPPPRSGWAPSPEDAAAEDATEPAVPEPAVTEPAVPAATKRVARRRDVRGRFEPETNGSAPVGAWGAPAPSAPDLPLREAQLRAGQANARRRQWDARDHPPQPAPRRGRTLDEAGRSIRVRVVERFPGQRVRQQTGPLRRIRSAVALLFAALLVGAVLAAGLTAVVWGISVAVHHATTN